MKPLPNCGLKIFLVRILKTSIHTTIKEKFDKNSREKNFARKKLEGKKFHQSERRMKVNEKIELTVDYLSPVAIHVGSIVILDLRKSKMIKFDFFPFHIEMFASTF